MLRDCCAVCLSVTLVYYGQTVGWIKMPLGMEVGLGPGDIVLDWDPALLPRKGHSSPPLFGPYLLWPNGRPSQQLLSSCFLILEISVKFQLVWMEHIGAAVMVTTC